MVLHNEAGGRISMFRERVLRKISDFILEAENGVEQIIGMQKITGLLLS